MGGEVAHFFVIRYSVWGFSFISRADFRQIKHHVRCTSFTGKRSIRNRTID